MIKASTKHDQDLADKIWKAFKPTLQEKHGQTGAQGKSGEDAALVLIEKHFEDVKYAISHEDALHQLLGIDITLIFNNGHSHFIDVKTGSSNLYYTQDDGWFITLKPSYLLTHKRYDHLMHLGPKKDLFAYYNKNEMIEFCNQKLPIVFDSEYKFKKRYWPSFIKSNF